MARAWAEQEGGDKERGRKEFRVKIFRPCAEPPGNFYTTNPNWLILCIIVEPTRSTELKSFI